MTTLQEQQYAKYSQYDTTKGVYYTQQERVEELNERMLERHFPDRPLEPNFAPRPVSTKYSVFPIMDSRKQSQEPNKTYENYNLAANFAPGNRAGPFSGYAVETENVLRNSTVALDRDYLQNQYIPSSQSDLYSVVIVSKPSIQPFEGLFRQTELAQPMHPNVSNTSIGKEQFFNHTRTQMRGGL